MGARVAADRPDCLSSAGRLQHTIESDRRGTRPAGPSRSVLAIDDDAGARAIFERVLGLEGLHVESAATGTAGLALAAMSRFDLALIDLRLPDMSGTEVIRRLREADGEAVVPRLVLVSGFLTTAITVEAMKAGAANVIEKPVSNDELVRVVASELEDPPPVAGSTPRTGADAALTCDVDARSDQAEPRIAPSMGIEPRVGPSTGRPGSIAERWALLVLKTCESPMDLKTLEDWAAYAGVSYSSLRETCHLVGVRPHDARDLTRVLRAVVRARHAGCSPEMLLDVCDSRTLSKLLARAGLGAARPIEATPRQLVASQKFVAAENAGLQTLSVLLARAGWL